MNPQIAIAQIAAQLPVPGDAAASSVPASMAGVRLRHLRNAAEIASVLHLRGEIDLSVHSANGPQFASLEKKETSAVLSSGSSWMAS